MPTASDIAGTVFKNGSCTLLARVVGATNVAVQQADLASARYTVYLLDDADPDSRTAVAGHSAVALTVASVVFDALQTGGLWDVDNQGYNLKVTLDVSTTQAFAYAGRNYLIVITLVPATGQEILVRFKVHAI